MKFFLFCILFFTINSEALAQATSGVARPIMLNVMTGDRPLTKDEHEAFWRAIRKGPPISDSELRKTMIGLAELNLEFQQLALESARESVKAGRIIRTQELEVAESNYLANAVDLASLSVAPRELASVKERISLAFASIQDDLHRLLSASASQTHFSLSQGATGTADLATIDQLITDVSATRKRIDQLLDPTWRELQK